MSADDFDDVVRDVMKDELFDDLVTSIKEAGEMKRSIPRVYIDGKEVTPEEKLRYSASFLNRTGGGMSDEIEAIRQRNEERKACSEQPCMELLESIVTSPIDSCTHSHGHIEDITRLLEIIAEKDALYAAQVKLTWDAQDAAAEMAVEALRGWLGY